MNELKVEVALEIMQLKIIHYIKNFNGNNKKEFEENLKILVDERQKIYDLDKDTINKVYDEYLPEIRKDNRNE